MNDAELRAALTRADERNAARRDATYAEAARAVVFAVPAATLGVLYGPAGAIAAAAMGVAIIAAIGVRHRTRTVDVPGVPDELVDAIRAGWRRPDTRRLIVDTVIELGYPLDMYQTLYNAGVSDTDQMVIAWCVNRPDNLTARDVLFDEPGWQLYQLHSGYMSPLDVETRLGETQRRLEQVRSHGPDAVSVATALAEHWEHDLDDLIELAVELAAHHHEPTAA